MGRPRNKENENIQGATSHEYHKAYMRKYYHTNFSKDACPTTCTHCGRQGTVQKIARHMATRLCKKRGKQVEDIEDIGLVQEMGKEMEDAMIPSNEVVVKGRLHINKTTTRRYPPIEVGDKVYVSCHGLVTLSHSCLARTFTNMF